jgi:hypothetical protein
MFDQFLQERVYLQGISRETQRYYKWVRRAFEPILAEPTKAGALACIQRLRDKGVKAISVNSYLCGFNAYCMWLHKEHGKELVKIPRLKEEQKVLATLTESHVRNLIS